LVEQPPDHRHHDSWTAAAGALGEIHSRAEGYVGGVDVTLPEPGSYWLADRPPPTYPEMGAPREVDVAIVGGGIAGITTAYLLKQAGHAVALVEARRLLHIESSCRTGGDRLVSA